MKKVTPTVDEYPPVHSVSRRTVAHGGSEQAMRSPRELSKNAGTVSPEQLLGRGRTIRTVTPRAAA